MVDGNMACWGHKEEVMAVLMKSGQVQILTGEDLQYGQVQIFTGADLPVSL